MMWPIFWPTDTDFSNPANTRHPGEDVDAAAKYTGDQIAAVVASSGTSDDPYGYGQAVARELFPYVLPYVIGTPASYGFAGFNGRTLADNAPEAMLSLVTGTAVPSGLKPSVARYQRADSFPYVIPGKSPATSAVTAPPGPRPGRSRTGHRPSCWPRYRR